MKYLMLNELYFSVRSLDGHSRFELSVLLNMINQHFISLQSKTNSQNRVIDPNKDVSMVFVTRYKKI